MILLALGMHITNLGYIESGPPRITELLKSSTEGLDFGLDYTATISNNDNQPLLDSSNSEAERARKKEEKAWKHK